MSRRPAQALGHPLDRLAWAALSTALLLAACAAIAPAHAQGQAVAPQTQAPTLPPADRAAPTPVPAPDGGIVAGPNAGIVHPGNPDPGITVPVAPQGRMPVIPPPGTPGGNPDVRPK